ncbi:MAG: helix-hairpin-helix domain-containing protein [Deltaproteobacteria bacterium]|nr:helix-hairpin-helix domain-containing protein [Deltaproteobacteria bacterium]
MKHRERHITSLLFIFLLVSINGTHILIDADRQTVTPQATFDAAFCHGVDWIREPPARRQLCGVGIFLNRDSEDALRYLPAIGPRRARDIVAYRTNHGPFRTVEDLVKVKGIGPATLKKIKPWIEDLSGPSESYDARSSR